jgi:hypothetical protein
VGRFDREQSDEGVPASIGLATEDLRSTVEEKLHEIVEAAEARAHEIEDRALEQAIEVEQDSERKARELFEASSERAEQLLAAVDSFEREIGEAISSLRRRGEALASELAPERPQEEAVEDGAEEHVSVAQAVEERAEPTPAEPETIAPEDAREQVRQRILDLFLAGKPRVEAERMLTQLDGGRYIELLDEVYEGRPETQQGSRRRRGGRRRRRPGSH